jgi:adenylate kinase family enzyme
MEGEKTMSSKRVSISGKITSGKTTCSEHLMEQYGFQRISFATPIKQIANWFQEYLSKEFDDNDDGSLMEGNKLFKYLVQVNLDNYIYASKCFDILINDIFPYYDDIDWSIEKSDRWRQLLQEIGNGLREQVNPTIWIDYTIETLDPDESYICDDLRYRNEYIAMERAGFTMIRLNIDPEVQQERINRIYGTIDPIRLQHSSEIDLDYTEFPYTINANQDLQEVLYHIDNIVKA